MFCVLALCNLWEASLLGNGGSEFANGKVISSSFRHPGGLTCALLLRKSAAGPLSVCEAAVVLRRSLF